jgi:uncharacterized protein (TIGR02145 family)
MSPLTDVPTGSEIVNAATGEPLLMVGADTTLALSVVNNSGAEVIFDGGVDPSTFAVYLPSPLFFTEQELAAMSVALPKWSATFDAEQLAILIVRTEAGTWADGEKITFPIAGAKSHAKPTNGTVLIGPSNMQGDVALGLEAPLVLADAPVAGNLSLPGVLEIALDSRGVVYRSPSKNDPVVNTLYLTIKNTGATALGTEAAIVGKPRVEVSFIYGSTSGALTFDSGERSNSPVGSAWNINASVGPAQLPWRALQPRKDGQLPHPVWTLEPVDPQILGPSTSPEANVTFAFDPVITTNPAGHTQILVLFTGFRKDENTEYDDHLFVLDVVKEDLPQTRGVLSFSGPDPVVEIHDPHSSIDVALRWAMFGVARVELVTSEPSLKPWSERYDNPRPLAYGNTKLTLRAPQSSKAIFATLQAFTGTGGYLNSQQFTVFAQVSYVIDPNGKVYATALFGDTFWMIENYDYLTSRGSYVYGKEATFGRLYDLEAAQHHAPDGWQLPSIADWQALIDRFGGGEPAYVELIDGGASGFAGQLGGRRVIQADHSGKFEQLHVYGYYWTAAGTVCAQFSSQSATVSVGTSVKDPQTALSVRYIRRA